MTARIFELPLEPSAWARPRAVVVQGRARMFTSHAQRASVGDLRLVLSAQGARPYPAHVPLFVTLTFRVRRPAAAPKRVVYPATRPDIDQYVKLILDAGNGLLWPDDAQIVSLHASKVFALDEEGGPSIRLAVTEMEA